MKLALRRAIALITPARIASGATPAERRLITSDSANTVHILVMACGMTFSVMLSSCSTLVPSVREITSEETPGACRAFVIHQEIAQVTVIIKLNHFAVLTTDVDYRARCWLKKPCAQPVTGDFRHLFIGKIHQLPSVAGERQKRRCL